MENGNVYIHPWRHIVVKSKKNFPHKFSPKKTNITSETYYHTNDACPITSIFPTRNIVFCFVYIFSSLLYNFYKFELFVWIVSKEINFKINHFFLFFDILMSEEV